ncbi:MAG: Re/Si-specific NAD(P)(+) transhydrogenase subunit alpha [Chloroflexales bacterium]|nr:Re/Si-specific NAD(P)(+) transhydrogenase subunit alpha [Chloroflexales bacterium]
MLVGVPKELYPGERRVALVPADVQALVKAGLQVTVEAGAGTESGYPDAEYQAKGATIAASRHELFTKADILTRVRAGGADPDGEAADLDLLHKGQYLVAFIEPLWYPASAARLAERGVSALAMELIPRISRAQSMDALSSQATIAGYKAVLLAADTLPRIFPMLMTAAGTIAPARAFVIGVGVAGLQALSTAKRLGAITEAYDVRPAVKDQVESVGAKFVELPLETAAAEDKGGYAKAQGEEFYRRQQELMAAVVARNDVVITTAAIPGKRSPVLVTAAMVKGMKPGAVIIDLAAERGGNCELTRPNEVVRAGGVTILGPTNLAATAPGHASQLYSRNVTNLLRHMVKDGAIQLDLEDEIVKDTLVTHGGEVTNQRVRDLLGTVAA